MNNVINVSLDLIKNNVLYIGQTGTSGYANAAKGYLYELLNKKIKVKSIQFSCDSSHDVEITEFDKYINQTRLVELTDPETTIIHSTPDIWEKIIEDLNVTSPNIIGRTVWEFEKLIPEWVECINNSKVTHVSVPTHWNKNCFINSGIKKPILVDPHIFIDFPYIKFNLDHFLTSKSTIFSEKEISHDRLENSYKFYTISQFTDRKGISDLIKVFCETYTDDDDVLLILKTFRDGHSLDEQKKCISILGDIIKNCNNQKYPPILYIKENLTFDEIKSLHNLSDCYISLAKAEGFGLGTFDAFNLNKPIITSGFGGHVEYLGNDYNGLVKYKEVSIKKESMPKFDFDDSYKWADLDLNEVSKLMIQNSNNKFEKFIRHNPVCIGEGIYDKEFDGKTYYKWASDELNFYIFDDTINSLILHFVSDFDGTIIRQSNSKKEEFIFNKGGNDLKISNLDKKITIKQTHFIPSMVSNSNDNRKLSYRLYCIDLLYKNGNKINYQIGDIKYITDEYYNSILNTNTLELNGKIIVEQGSYGEMFIKTTKNNIKGKINLNSNQISFYSHRSGWDYALSGLFDFHNNCGIIMDGFLENAFVWRKEDFIHKKIIPYKKPWIGFFHNPPNMPTWFSDNSAYPNSILNDKYFKQSIEYCKGLYVLSQYHKKYLEVMVPQVPIDVLYHPTEIPDSKFNFEKFVKNKNKSIINIGWWLRKLNSFYLLDSPYQKIRLLPNNKCKDTIFRLSKIERALYDIQLTSDQNKSVKLVDHLSNESYDQFLTENIVFLDLYDSSANNAIIECIARGTPLLINRHPAIIEYLGEEYPFYFSDYDDAKNKLNNLDLIKFTNQYLMEYDLRKNIMLTTFVNEFEKSKIYQQL